MDEGVGMRAPAVAPAGFPSGPRKDCLVLAKFSVLQYTWSAVILQDSGKVKDLRSKESPR